jgi:hypothetical protein
MNIRAAQMIMYGLSAWVSSVPALLVFYPILFYSIHTINPIFSQVITGCGTSHLKYKIYRTSKMQKYFLGYYAMFIDK